jgi:methylenetetrahydrofolate reductase (NADPH)
MQDTRDAVAEVLRRPRYEVIPLEGIERAVARHVPKEIKLTVTASPKKGLEPTLRLAEHLSTLGYKVAPHLSARLVTDREHLRDILRRLDRLDIRDAFVVAGDADEPAGEFEGAHALLVAMAEIGHGLEEIGITGYPESHPFISDEATIQAMYDKAPYATYIVSQICFDPKVTVAWIRAVRDRGVDLPLYIGVPGVVNAQKLLRVSTSIGLGESARFLRKQGGSFLRVFKPGGYSPEHLIERLIPSVRDPRNNVQGFHIYTFNELANTETWRRGMLDRVEARMGQPVQ